MNVQKKMALSFVSGTAAAAAIAGAMSMIDYRPAAAKPQFVQQTGLPCAQCHQTPAGGKLTSFGEKFQQNGNKLPKDSPK